MRVVVRVSEGHLPSAAAWARAWVRFMTHAGRSFSSAMLFEAANVVAEAREHRGRWP